MTAGQRDREQMQTLAALPTISTCHIVLVQGYWQMCACPEMFASPEIRGATKKWRQTRLNVVKAVALPGLS